MSLDKKFLIKSILDGLVEIPFEGENIYYGIVDIAILRMKRDLEDRKINYLFCSFYNFYNSIREFSKSNEYDDLLLIRNVVEDYFDCEILGVYYLGEENLLPTINGEKCEYNLMDYKK